MSADCAVFSPGHAQFRLVRVPIALDPFRGRLVTTVRERLAWLEERVTPIVLRLGRAASALPGGGHGLLLSLHGAGIRGGALVVHGSLDHLEDQ